MMYKTMIVGLSLGLFLLVNSCDPEIKGKCDKNDECIDGYLCNKENQCIEVEQVNLEIITVSLDDAVVGNEYSYTLTAKGGLKPYTWSIETGPNGLTVIENTQTHAWSIAGTPTEFQTDPVSLKLRLTDNSIDEQSTTKDLSIKILYCSSKLPGVICSGFGTCNAENKCECNEAYAGNQCELCDEENGYERNDEQLCVKYEYQCESDACGADLQRRSCVGTLCTDWTVNTECTDNQVCLVTTELHECRTCEMDCENGKCNGCTEGPCCYGGILRPSSWQCASGVEYRCISQECGAVAQQKEWTQNCGGTSSECDGNILGEWVNESNQCTSDQICWANDAGTGCTNCEHGCKNGTCNECSPGPCCDDNDGKLRPSSWKCESWTEFGCSSSECGAVARQREVSKYCHGATSGCDGSVVEENWSTIQSCNTTSQECNTNGSSFAECVSCEVGMVCSKGNCSAVEWVSLPGGRFDMGWDDNDYQKPIHSVDVPAFEIGRTEVTVNQYQACINAGVCSDPDTDTQSYCNWGVSGRDEHPINCVDWHQAVAFCEWAVGRLPSESEWEYAATSGGKAGYLYPWGALPDASCDHVVMWKTEGYGCGLDSSWSVCGKEAGNTEQGLCDMSGNVWEVVQDCYHDNYDNAPNDGSWWGGTSDCQRVVRGGSWLDGFPSNLSSRDRIMTSHTSRHNMRGFRCARDAP